MREVLLTEICDIQYGFAFDSALFSESEGVPLVRIRDVVRGFSETYTKEPFPAEYEVQDGDILIGMDGEFNIAKWNGGKAALNQRVCKLIPQAVDSGYIFYFMPIALKKIEEKTPFVTVKHLSAKELNKIYVPLPSMVQQKAIAQTLDKVNELISLRKKQLQKLDDLVKSRFVEMFGDVIHNTMGWPTTMLSEVTTSRLGKMLDSKRRTGHHLFPYLANFNVQWFRFELDSLNQMDFDEREQIEFQLADGDLLVCEGGEIGRCAVWHNDVQSCFFQKALHRVRCNTNIILPDFLARWFQYNCEHGGFSSIEGAKATISHLPGEKLKKLLVIIPPMDKQYEFVTFVKHVDSSRLTIQSGLNRMVLLKQSLMQEYFQ